MRFGLVRSLPVVLAAALLAAAPISAFSQPVNNRIAAGISSGAMVRLRGTVSPRIAGGIALGRLNPGTRIDGITMFFAPSATQKAELDALVKAQQTPGSPEYHQWLTPAEYADMFGLSPSDVAKVENWLESQGFNVESVAPSRNAIVFSGTAEQVETAFRTQMEQYRINGETHFANATPLSIPAALEGVASAVMNLTTFRLHPMVDFKRQVSARPAFTSAQTGNHFFTPGDVATIYDVTPAYDSGFNGSGETIAVVGQSAIQLSDIEAFQTADGQTVKDPNLILVPNTGTSTVVSGDESESDLDLEYSGGMAPGATIDFVYTGSNSNAGVFNALQYAVANDVAPVISMSYGGCETQLSAQVFGTYETVLQQAATQGQTVVVSSGDTGSTGCWGTTNTSTAQQQALAVQYPASSAYVTAVGGTEFPAADVASTNTTYWKSANGSDVVSSALSYIPEIAWNDDVSCGQYATQTNSPSQALCSGGGGTSATITRPSWQTGVPGISAGNYRLVPDVSLNSSPNVGGYLFCTSDKAAWNTTSSPIQQASCNSGFRDAATGELTVAGGTSFAAPIFAGMMAIMNQELSAKGLGEVNTKLYTLAASSSTYAAAFHDITSGGNNCTAGSPYCTGAAVSDYLTTAGYDEATGLGSIDFANLEAAWAATVSGGGGTGSASFGLSAANVSAAQGSSVKSTVTIASLNSYAGTVNFAVSATSGSSLATYGCYAINNTGVTAGSTATATLTIYTSKSACSASGVQSFVRKGAGTVASSKDGSPLRRGIPAGAAALAGVLLFGFRKSRKMRTLLGCLVVVAMLSFAAGCGGTSGTSPSNNSGGGTSTSTDVAKGTYTVTVKGTDSANSSLTASTTFTLTVD